MKRYVIELTDDLSYIYEDIARVNKKAVEECLSLILERVIRTMISWAGPGNATVSSGSGHEAD